MLSWVNKLMKNEENSQEVFLENSKKTLLRDLLCERAEPISSFSDDGKEMMQALKYLGTILVSAHMFQYHRGALIPTGKTTHD